MDSKNIKNGYYKLKTDDGPKWLHFSRLFIDKIKEVSGKNILEFGEYLKSLDNDLNMMSQFDAITDLTMAAMMAYDEKEGNDIDYDLYKVGEWLYWAMEEDEKVLVNIFDALKAATESRGKSRKGRFTPPKRK